MTVKHRDVSTETRADLDAEGPLRRWARRRREVAREKEAADEARRRDGRRDESPPPSDAREPTLDASEPAVVEEKVLTDEDMPPLDSLDENSDYSGFLSSGVSEELRRRALRKLFSSAVFNIPDGLDDYDDDFTTFAALGDIVTSDMRHQAEVEAERARQARADSGAAVEPGAETGGVDEMQPAHAGDREEVSAGVESAGVPDASESPVLEDPDPPEFVRKEDTMERGGAARESTPVGSGAREPDLAGGGSAAGVTTEDRHLVPLHDGMAAEEVVSTGSAVPSEHDSPTSVTDSRASGGAESTTDADDANHGRA